MFKPCRESALRLSARSGIHRGITRGWRVATEGVLQLLLLSSLLYAPGGAASLDVPVSRPLSLSPAPTPSPTPARGTRVERGRLHLELETGVSGQSVAWVSNANDWDEGRTLLQEIRPGFYAVELPEPWVPTLVYKFVVDGQWQPDPQNPNRESDGWGGWNSILPLSFREDPLLTTPGGAPYVERSFTFRGRSPETQRSVTVLRPRSSARARQAVVLYFQDGGDYLERASIRTLLANLALDPTLPPLAAVLIPPLDRMKEYGLTGATIEYARFLRDDVIPRVETTLGIGGTRQRRALIGPSLGGLVTLYLAVDLEDLFGTAISQSGSIWFKNEAITRFLETAPLSKTRLFLTVGAFETPTMVRTNRTLADRLRERGDVDFEYHEFPTGHDWRGWRNQLSFIFRSLFSRALLSTESRD